MNRRSFLPLIPAFPVAAVTATLVVKEDGKEPIEADVSVLKLQPGDTLVIRCRGRITQETATRVQQVIEERVYPGVKAIVLDDGLTIEGVLRHG